MSLMSGIELIKYYQTGMSLKNEWYDSFPDWYDQTGMTTMFPSFAAVFAQASIIGELLQYAGAVWSAYG